MLGKTRRKERRTSQDKPLLSKPLGVVKRQCLDQKRDKRVTMTGLKRKILSEDTD